MNNNCVRIGILTYHRSVNYGAFMQCYSLSQRLIKDYPNAKIEVIDFCTKDVFDRYNPRLATFIFGPKHLRNSLRIQCKNLIKLLLQPEMIKEKKLQYEAFQRNLKLLPLSARTVISNELKCFEDAFDNNYDIIIVGSDAVWEYKTYPFPNPYFMHNNLHAMILSYAASADRMHISIINETEKDYIKQSLLQYNYIGIRDISTEHILDELIPGKKWYHNCDPTAFLDIELLGEYRKSVFEKLKKSGVDFTKPIIGVMAGTYITRVLKRYFGNRCSIVSVYNYNEAADYNLCNLEPLEWSVVFSFFDITFTRYFHGTWLSLKNNTPTIIIDDWNQEDSLHDSKLLDLAKRLNLIEWYFRFKAVKSNEGKNRLFDTAEMILGNKCIVDIQARIIKEKNSYASFNCHLSRLIDSMLIEQ